MRIMTLLFITRKIDYKDERAGFVVDWLQELALGVTKLVVICQEEGAWSNKPNNVAVYSLGKELGYSKIRQFINFQLLAIKLVGQVDGVLAHMMPLYGILAGPWCKIFRKKLAQWYAHGTVDWRLKLADFWVDTYITSSLAGLRLKTKKPIQVIGQGINVKFFVPKSGDKAQNPQDEKFKILSVGRISPTKNLDTLIKAVEDLQLNESKMRDNFLVQIIGGPGKPEQAAYMKDLQKEVKSKNLNKVVDFLGPLQRSEILSYYQNCDLFINLSETGSLDKAVLEAMACGSLVLTSNEAYKNILPYELFLEDKSVKVVAQKIKEIYKLAEVTKKEIATLLLKEVTTNHNLENFIKRIIAVYAKQWCKIF